jgi:tetratricopeptide (TPR) repeat protein
VASHPANTVEVFYSYSHLDEALRQELVKHLSNLERQKVITGWHDRKITAGTEWSGAIDEHLDSAHVILLLISADFMASPYCNDIEVKRAMERHEAGEARVIPVILRPCDWNGAPFSKLQALPTDAKPVTSWDNQDEAFLDIVKGIRRAVETLLDERAATDADDNPSISTNIPRPPVVGFVGRRDRGGRDIVEHLMDELAPQKHQLVVLWGAGGVGKSTLAAEAARALAEDFDQRIVWVSADGRTDLPVTTLLDEIATQLGSEELRRLTPKQRSQAVRALLFVPPALVILDNYETISAPEQARCLEFLEHAPCSALITTREKIDRVRLVPVAAMSPEEADEFLQRMITQTQDPTIYEQLDRQRLIRTAEANPLIIEWIVGQIDLANDPDEVLNELSQGEGHAAQRVFDRSFNLPQLKDGGRAVLLALSLFTPDASRRDVAKVTGFNFDKPKDRKRFKKAQETLASLWLIKKTDGGHRLAVAGLTRDLTKAHLSADRSRDKTFRQRFLTHFLTYAQKHKQMTPENLNALEMEKDNLLVAMDVAFEMKEWQVVQLIAYIISAPVSGVLSVRGYWDEAIQRSAQGMRAAHEANDERMVSVFTCNTATIRMLRGEYDEAERAYKQALSVFRRIGDEANTSVVLHQLGELAVAQGKLEEARLLYGESLEIEKRWGNQSGIADSLHSLGVLAQSSGEFDEARRRYEESLEIKKKLGDQIGIATTLHHLGRFAQSRGEIEEAQRLYGESLELDKRIGNQAGIATSLCALGHLAEEMGDNSESAYLLRRALSIFEKLGSADAQIVREELERLEGESE